MHPRFGIQILAAVLTLGSSSCQCRDGESLEGRSISHFEFRFEGTNTIAENRLMYYVSSRSGTTFSSKVVDADLTRLYESGLVDDLYFLTEPDGDSVRIIAVVSTRPPNRTFSIGNSSFSSKRLSEECGLWEADPITVETLEVSRQKLKRFYVSQGYSEVSVSARSIDGGKACPDDFVFVIEEGSKGTNTSSRTPQAEADQPATAPESKAE